MKYAAIADWAEEKEYSITFMCDQLGVCRQGYYRWRASGPGERERTDAELTEAIRQIHAELEGNPGVRRIHAELAARRIRVGPKRVWRLMRAAGCADATHEPGRKPPSQASDPLTRRI